MSFQTERIAQIITVAFPLFLLTALGVITWSIRTASRKPSRAVVVPVSCAALFYYVLLTLPLVVELNINRLLPVTTRHLHNAGKLTRPFPVADLHCDVLLWVGRDFTHLTFSPFNKRQIVGHVDLPRLRKGHVKLQVFAIVNSVPRDNNFVFNKAPAFWRDSITLKAVLERWEFNSWFSPKNRVLFAARRLHDAQARPHSALTIVRSKDDLPPPGASLKQSQADGDMERVHGIIAVEGLSSLDKQVSNVDKFYEAGVRVMGPTHFHDTEIGGSLSGECKCGLTDFGRHAVRRMKELGMIVDFTHAHPEMMNDILDLPDNERPAVMVSHTGVNAVCNNSRNMDDTLLRRVADAGGIIGVALFDPAICGDDLVDSFVKTVRHIAHVTQRVDMLALGSDWDGAVRVIVTPDRTDILAGALLDDGFSEDEVSQILYDNAVRFFSHSLR